MPVKFYLESRPNKANEHPIRVSICIKSVKYISTVASLKEQLNIDLAACLIQFLTDNK